MTDSKPTPEEIEKAMQYESYPHTSVADLAELIHSHAVDTAKKRDEEWWAAFGFASELPVSLVNVVQMITGAHEFREKDAVKARDAEWTKAIAPQSVSSLSPSKAALWTLGEILEAIKKRDADWLSAFAMSGTGYDPAKVQYILYREKVDAIKKRDDEWKLVLNPYADDDQKWVEWKRCKEPVDIARALFDDYFETREREAVQKMDEKWREALGYPIDRDVNPYAVGRGLRASRDKAVSEATEEWKIRYMASEGLRQETNERSVRGAIRYNEEREARERAEKERDEALADHENTLAVHKVTSRGLAEARKRVEEMEKLREANADLSCCNCMRNIAAYREEREARERAEKERDQRHMAAETFADQLGTIRLEHDQLKAEVERHRQDAVLAAGELGVSLPEPGTDAARLLKANRLLITERDELKAEIEGLKANHHAPGKWADCKRCVELYAQDETGAAENAKMSDAIKQLALDSAEWSTIATMRHDENAQLKTKLDCLKADILELREDLETATHRAIYLGQQEASLKAEVERTAEVLAQSQRARSIQEVEGAALRKRVDELEAKERLAETDSQDEVVFILEQARREGAEEMRENLADFVGNLYPGLLLKDLDGAIRAYPFDPPKAQESCQHTTPRNCCMGDCSGVHFKRCNKPMPCAEHQAREEKPKDADVGEVCPPDCHCHTDAQAGLLDRMGLTHGFTDAEIQSLKDAIHADQQDAMEKARALPVPPDWPNGGLEKPKTHDAVRHSFERCGHVPGDCPVSLDHCHRLIGVALGVRLCGKPEADHVSAKPNKPDKKKDWSIYSDHEFIRGPWPFGCNHTTPSIVGDVICGGTEADHVKKDGQK